MTSCSSCDDRKRVEDSTRKKSFQIILPFDVDIVFVFTRKGDNRAKWSPEVGEGATVLYCQLPPLRAEGSKNHKNKAL